MLMAILLPLLIFGLALGHGLHDTQMVIAILCGAIGGVFPDGLQFVYWKLRREPLYSLQKFHQWIQNEQLHPYPLAGVMAQATLILLIVGSRYLL